MIVPVHLVDDVRAVRVVGAGVVVVNNVLASARVTAHWVALLLRGGGCVGYYYYCCARAGEYYVVGDFLAVPVSDVSRNRR